MTQDKLVEAFRIVLTDEQLRDLGRLSAIWSQIDFQIAIAIGQMMKVDYAQVEAFLENTMTGARLSLMRKQLGQIADDDTRRIAINFLGNMDRLLGKRNHITHGIWGWHINDQKEAKRASHFSRSKLKPIYATELASLAAECHVEAQRINTVLAKLTGIVPEDGKPPDFYFGDGPPQEHGDLKFET